MVRSPPIPTLLTAVAVALSGACGERDDEDRPGLLVVEPEGALPEPRPLARTGPGVDEGPSERPREPTPPQIVTAPLPDAVTVAIAPTGGELETGGYRIVIPSLEEATEATLTPLRGPQLRSPQPLSQPLAAAELLPAFRISEGMMQLTLPLDRPVETGTTLQLLAFSRSMDAFTVVDQNRVTSNNTVSFRTDVFSQYAVIAVPEIRETSCFGGPFRLNQREPDRHEHRVVGRVEPTERIGRDTALATLTDMRYLPGSENIVFKNEERRGGSEDAPPPHEGEDFLVDPRLASPLIELGQGVLSQWVDPIGGGPAFQLRVTDAYDSQLEHSTTSNHYRGLAIDLTLSPVPAAHQRARAEHYGWLSRLAVCAGFEFVDFENRFHVHVASRGARLAWIEENDEGRSVVLTRIDGTQRQVLSERLDLDLSDRDPRAMRFGPNGRSLEMLADHKGRPEGFLIDLDRFSVSPIPAPNPLPPRQATLVIDPSLLIEQIDDHFVLARPARHTEGQSAEAEPALYRLNDEATRAIVPAVWTERLHTGGAPPVGELRP